MDLPCLVSLLVLKQLATGVALCDQRGLIGPDPFALSCQQRVGHPLRRELYPILLLDVCAVCAIQLHLVTYILLVDLVEDLKFICQLELNLPDPIC